MKMTKAEWWRALKFVLFSISAGVIQFGVTAILSLIWPKEVFPSGPVVFYAIGLTLGVIYNLTINRKFTFKSVKNFPLALGLTIAFYVVFAPASCVLQAWLTNGVILIEAWTIPHLGWHELLGVFICMVINLLLEWPYQRYLVFGKSCDNDPKAVEKKETETKEENK